MKTLPALAFAGLVVAAGFASSPAALAQNAPAAPSNSSVNDHVMMNGDMTGMMGQMNRMMENCNRMMQSNHKGNDEKKPDTKGQPG